MKRKKLANANLPRKTKDKVEYLAEYKTDKFEHAKLYRYRSEENVR